MPSVMPTPQTDADQARCIEQAMRYRVLKSAWTEDALEREKDFFDKQLSDSFPPPETSRNPALMIVDQLATLCDDQPETDAGGADLEALKLPIFWSMSQERCALVEGINECLMRVDFTRDDATGEGLSYRVVPPHLVLHAASHDNRPDLATRIEELREKTDAQGDPGWVVEVWDVTDPANPIREDHHKQSSGAGDVVEALEWPEAYRDNSGAPVLPYVLWHKRVTAALWSPDPGRELFMGTLTTASLMTFWAFGMRDAAYGVRVIIDGEISGRGPIGQSGAQGVTVDPRVVLDVQSKGDRPAQITAWEGTMDITAYSASVEQYMAGLALYAGISPSDVTTGSSVESGYAIVVKRSGQRRARQKQMLPARMGDTLMLSKAAKLLNKNTSSALPEAPEDYQITYARIEESPSERAARVAEVTALLDAGLIDPTEAYTRLNPGTTPEQAVEALADIAKSRALLSAATSPPDMVATLQALTAAGDRIDDRSYYYILSRLGLLHPDLDPDELARAREAAEIEEVDDDVPDGDAPDPVDPPGVPSERPPVAV
jgi:hypothetical protein